MKKIGSSMLPIILLAGTILVMAWKAERRNDPRPETFRGVSLAARKMTPEERADDFVRAIELVRSAGWEPTLEDLTWPEDWTPPEGWEPPEGWRAPEWWPER